MEVCVYRAVDDGYHAEQGESHRYPKLLVMQLVAREKSVLAAPLEDIDQLSKYDCEVGHGHGAHMNQTAGSNVFGAKVVPPVVEKVIGEG